jgi:hypothetical protein
LRKRFTSNESLKQKHNIFQENWGKRARSKQMELRGGVLVDEFVVKMFFDVQQFVCVSH